MGFFVKAVPLFGSKGDSFLREGYSVKVALLLGLRSSSIALMLQFDLGDLWLQRTTVIDVAMFDGLINFRMWMCKM